MMSFEDDSSTDHFAAGIQRQITSHIRWLRSNRAHWGAQNVQGEEERQQDNGGNEGQLEGMTPTSWKELTSASAAPRSQPPEVWGPPPLSHGAHYEGRQERGEEDEGDANEVESDPVEPTVCEEEEGAEGAEALPDDEEIHYREEHYQELRRTMGVGNEADGDTAPPATLAAIQELWTPVSAGELLSRVDHFLGIVSQMMEEVGYMMETPARGHREGGQAANNSSGERGEDEEAEDRPATLSNMPPPSTMPPKERNTRHEHLTDADWAIMAAVGTGNCSSP